MRALALACLLVVSVASSAQAVHAHGRWLLQQQAQADAPADASQVPGGETHCLLCLAMHSALPVQVRVEPVQLVLVEQLPPTTAGFAPETVWHFARFSRPPPVAAN
jgi:hypothetical protein